MDERRSWMTWCAWREEDGALDFWVPAGGRFWQVGYRGGYVVLGVSHEEPPRLRWAHFTFKPSEKGIIVARLTEAGCQAEIAFREITPEEEAAARAAYHTPPRGYITETQAVDSMMERIRRLPGRAGTVPNRDHNGGTYGWSLRSWIADHPEEIRLEFRRAPGWGSKRFVHAADLKRADICFLGEPSRLTEIVRRSEAPPLPPLPFEPGDIVQVRVTRRRGTVTAAHHEIERAQVALEGAEGRTTTFRYNEIILVERPTPPDPPLPGAWIGDEQDTDGRDDLQSVEIATTIPTGMHPGLAPRRVGQDLFSRAVRENYGYRCCIPGCGVDEDTFLVGAHIARWADDESRRGDVANGLCLCLMHDRAFEVGYFTIDRELRVAVNLAHPDVASSSWCTRFLTPVEGQPIRVGQIPPDLAALCQHWRRIGWSEE